MAITAAVVADTVITGGVNGEAAVIIIGTVRLACTCGLVAIGTVTIIAAIIVAVIAAAATTTAAAFTPTSWTDARPAAHAI
jgi:hypothetical protein